MLGAQHIAIEAAHRADVPQDKFPQQAGAFLAGAFKPRPAPGRHPEERSRTATTSAIFKPSPLRHPYGNSQCHSWTTPNTLAPRSTRSKPRSRNASVEKPSSTG